MPHRTIWWNEALFARLKAASIARVSNFNETVNHFVHLGLDQNNLLSSEASALVDAEISRLSQKRWQVLSELVIDGYQWRMIRDIKKRKNRRAIINR